MQRQDIAFECLRVTDKRRSRKVPDPDIEACKRRDRIEQIEKNRKREQDIDVLLGWKDPQA